jgi:hypothetical protein
MDDKRFLTVMLHHCNDYRHVTETVVSAWFCVPTDYIFGSCVSRPALPSTTKQAEESPGKYLAEEDKGTVWISGNDIIKSGAEANKDTLLVPPIVQIRARVGNSEI